MRGDLAAAPGGGSRTAEWRSFAREVCEDAGNRSRSIDTRPLLRQTLEDAQAAEEAAYEREAAKLGRTQPAEERWLDRQAQQATTIQANLTV
eukprot:5441081-Pyramimonas_sp.AAC.1